MADLKFKNWDVYVTGKLSWLTYENLDKYDKWSVVVHPNPESLEVLRDLQSQGMKNNMKKDEDGYFMRFSRVPQKTTARGKTLVFKPPKVLDGTKPDGKGGFMPIEGIRIGNGSTGVVKINVYEHPTPQGGKSVACRFESARIDDLVPFEAARDFTDDEKANVQGLAEQPEALW